MFALFIAGTPPNIGLQLLDCLHASIKLVVVAVLVGVSENANTAQIQGPPIELEEILFEQIQKSLNSSKN